MEIGDLVKEHFGLSRIGVVVEGPYHVKRKREMHIKKLVKVRWTDGDIEEEEVDYLKVINESR